MKESITEPELIRNQSKHKDVDNLSANTLIGLRQTNYKPYWFELATDLHRAQGRSELSPTIPSFEEIRSAAKEIPCPVIVNIDLPPQNTTQTVDVQLFGTVYFPKESDKNLRLETEQTLRELCNETDLTYNWKANREGIPNDTTSTRLNISIEELAGLLAIGKLPSRIMDNDVATTDGADAYLDQTETMAWFPIGTPYLSNGKLSDTTWHVLNWESPSQVMRLTHARQRARPASGVPKALAHHRDVSHSMVYAEPVFAFDAHGHTLTQIADLQRFLLPEPFENGESVDPAKSDHRPYVYCLDVEETLATKLADRTRVEYEKPLEHLLAKVWKQKSNIIFDMSGCETPRIDTESILLALESLVEGSPVSNYSARATLAIDDPVLLLSNSKLNSLADSTQYQQHINMLLNVRHPFAMSPAAPTQINPQTTQTQIRTLDNLINSSVDLLLVENSKQVWDLLKHDDFSLRVETMVERELTQNRDTDWVFVQTDLDGFPVPAGSVDYAPDQAGLPLRYSSATSNFVEISGRNHLKLCFESDQILGGVDSINWENYSETNMTAKTIDEKAKTTDNQPATGEVTSRIARPTQVNKTNLPQGATVNEHSNNYVCEHCGERYDLTQKGLHRVCQCCEKSVELVDRERLREIPPIRLKLSEEEIDASPLSQDQLRLLKAIYLAKRFRFDPVSQFDPLTESMKLIIDDLGIDSDAVESLCDYTDEDNQAYLSKQTSTTVHTVYNITSAGRTHIREPAKEGYDWGVGQGDLNESTLHRIGVALLCYWLSDEYADDPDRSVTAYHKLPNGKVIDAVVLDGTGEVVVAAEMECENNDVTGEGSSPRSTYSKLAALDLEEAIWVFETGGHWEAATADLATASTGANDEFDFREKGYSRSYLSSNPKLEFSGMTKAMTLSTLSKLAPYPPGLYGRDPTRFLS
ncbi:hypothetical protein ACFQHN_31895 [Natrialbaceae archaeon GCM10025896]|uniref:hypothetical protein n=1 Tax=Halovenus amylolytica TaxID=2500550 RepID=UPI000FE3492F